MWLFPLRNHVLDVPSVSWHPGRFGFKRKFNYHHTGVDLYATHGDSVLAVEDGKIVEIENFTGTLNGTPWWNDTWALLVEGESGVVVYGEIHPKVQVGDYVTRGQEIGTVLTVLKEQEELKDWIPGHSRSMLHLELHQRGTRATSWWWSGESQPKGLLDPTRLLINSERDDDTMDKAIYHRLQARKIGYEHLIGMPLEEAKNTLESQGKEVTHTEWNPQEQYLEDGIFVENQVNLVLKDGIVWSVSLSYDNSVV